MLMTLKEDPMKAIIILILTIFLIPIIELLVGILKPVKNINSVIGYRTAKTRSSQEMWDYGQLMMKKYMLRAGIISLILGNAAAAVCFIAPEKAGVAVGAIIGFQTISVLVVVVMLEVAMNKKMGK